MTLNNGLTLTGTGVVNLGGGTLIVNDATSSISSGSLTAANQYIGSLGIGAFSQRGGYSTISQNLCLGNYATDSGTYTLSAGRLAGANECVGNFGNGTFNQSGGTNAVGTELDVSSAVGSTGTYNLTGTGLLSAATEYIGCSGTGTLTQTGGTNAISSALTMGDYSYSGMKATYSLGGSGVLSSAAEILYNTSILQQTGGLNATANLTVENGGTLELGGGTLQINGNLLNQGMIEGAGGTAVISIAGSACADFSQGTVIGTGSLSVIAGPNSLVIVPAGFNTATQFGKYSSLGITHTASTTLVVPAGQGFSCATTIVDPVVCQGAILAPPGGALNLSNGLILSGTGVANLGTGILTVSDTASGMSGGSLTAATQCFGGASAGTFTQTGGTNVVSSGFNVGYSRPGSYNLSGNGLLLSSATENIGGYYGGTDIFTQTAGTNTTAALDVGNYGTYVLGGSGHLSAAAEFINAYSSGLLQQSGGLNTTDSLFIGTSGTLQLSGGTVQLNGNLVNQGAIDGAGGRGVLSIAGSTIADFSQGSLVNAGSMSVTVGPDSLVIVPAGFNTATALGHYTSLGLTHTASTTLIVPAGQGFGGGGTITDPVNCQGTILATFGWLDQPEQRLDPFRQRCGQPWRRESDDQ